MFFRDMKVKRFAILSASIGYLCAWRLRQMARRLSGGADRGTCVVLYYHEVRPEHRMAFARQMDILLRLAQPVRADRTEGLCDGVRYAAVTFDDGFQSVVDQALPELEKRGIPATMFIVTEALGKCPDWLTDSNHPAKGQSVISVNQLTRLNPEVVALGSHTLTHPRLTQLTDEDAAREILHSRRKLEQILNREVRLFSFPFGAWNEGLADRCREAGYSRVFTISPALAFSSGAAEFVTGRVSVEPTDWPLEFRLKVLGAYQWLPIVRGLKRRFQSALAARTGSKRRAPEIGAAEEMPTSNVSN